MTTVRILGSRAREQMPGTSITLLAPGFRGALTQQAAGVASGGDYDLPFGGAAPGAEITLASQLTLNLEARTEAGGLGLRSRSAMVAHPRVIVPRRNGVAYAMLQTDETGASSFVLPASNDETEAAFPLTIAAQGTTRRVLRVLTWPIQPVLSAGAPAIAGRWERLRRPNQLAQYTGNGQWLTPDWRSLGDGAVLLLLHDTFSTPQAAFADWIGDASFAPVHQQFGGRCLAFTHPTLASGIEENLSWLVTHLPQLPGPIDIVAHGRGGLLARAIAADGRLPLRRVCLVGTPNNGTIARAVREHVALSRRPRGHAGAHLDERRAGHARGGVVHVAFRRARCCLAVARHRSAAAGQRIAEAIRILSTPERSSGSRWVRSSPWRVATPTEHSTISRPHPTTWWCPAKAVTTWASRFPTRCASAARTFITTTTSRINRCVSGSRAGCACRTALSLRVDARRWLPAGAWRNLHPSR